MRDTFWLIVTPSGVARLARGGTRRGRTPNHRPALKQNEYAVLLTVQVPDTVFKPAPLPSAMLVIPERAIIAPPVNITVEEPVDVG